MVNIPMPSDYSVLDKHAQFLQQLYEVADDEAYLYDIKGLEKEWDRLIQNWLDEEDNDVNTIVDNHGSTLLHYIINHIDFDYRESMLNFLIGCGADLTLRNNSGETPLNLACHVSNDKAAWDLIRSDADVITPDNDGYTPLQRACHFGDVGFIEPMIHRGASPNISNNVDGRNCLHCVACESHIHCEDMMRFLIENGGEDAVNSRDNEGKTPLHLVACTGERLDVMHLLIQNGAEVNATDNEGKTPLHWLVHNAGGLDILRLLTNAGAEVNARDNEGKTPLHLVACTGERLDVMHLLIQNGAEVNATDNEGKTPLHWLVHNAGGLDMLQLLTNVGAEVNARDNEGKTPLQIACRRQASLNAIWWLLVNGADVINRDNRGYTPLHCAFETGQFSVINLLLISGANLAIESEDGATPMHVAHPDVLWSFMRQDPLLVLERLE